MRIRIEETCTCVRYSVHNYDPDKYYDWLDGEEPTKDNLMEYLNDNWDVYDEWTDDYDTEEEYFSSDSEVEDAIHEVKLIHKIPKPTIY